MAEPVKRRFFLKRILLRVYHDDGSDREQTQSARLALYLAAGIPSLIFFISMDLAQSSPTSVAVLFTALLLQVLSCFLRHREGQLTRACYVFLGSLTLIMTLCHLWDGNEQSMSLWLIPALPMATAMLLGTRAAVMNMFVATAIVLVAMFSSKFIDMPQEIDTTDFHCLTLRLAGMVFFGLSGMISMNVTRKQAQLLLDQRNEVQKLKQKHHDAIASKSSFFAGISHEIRTPMNGILGMTGFLNGSKLADPLKADVSLMHRCAGELIELLNQILDLSSLEMKQPAPTLERVPLAEALKEQVARLDHDPTYGHVHYELDQVQASTTVWADPEVLARALALILDCAGESCERGRVHLREVHHSDAQEPGVELRIVYAKGQALPVRAANDLRHTHHNDTVRSANVALSIAAQLVLLIDARLHVQTDQTTQEERISILFPDGPSNRARQEVTGLDVVFWGPSRWLSAIKQRMSDSHRSQQSLILSFIHLVIAPGSVGFFLDATYRGYFMTAGTLGLSLILLGLAVWVNYRNKNTNLASWLSVASTMSIMAFTSIVDGQIRSESLWILPTVSIGTMFALGQRAFVGVSIMSFLILIAVYFTGIYFPVAEEYQPTLPYVTVLRLINLQIFGGVCIIASVVSEGFSRRYRAQRVAMVQALDASEKAYSEKSKFLTNMSHEIRTPMNGILGLAEGLVQQDLPEEQRQAVQTIHRCGGHLLAILSEVLNLNETDGQNTSLSKLPFSVKEIIDDVVYLFSKKAEMKGLTLVAGEVDPELCVIGDPTKMMQVLSNLVGNAVKFTDHGSVEVTLTKAMPTTRGECAGFDLEITVRDQGIGIALSQQEALFHSYVQVEGPSGIEREGTGLGLAISRKLVRAMGGELEFESAQGEGSTFRLRIWLPDAQRLRNQKTVASSKPSKPSDLKSGQQIILVVDDNAINLKVASAALHRLGYRTDLAKDGQEAIDLAQETRYDAILMDIRMPGVDGLQATRAIRASTGASKHTPIVALTADSYEEQRQLCFEAGMNDHLAKPFRAKELQARLAAIWDLSPDTRAAV